MKRRRVSISVLALAFGSGFGGAASMAAERQPDAFQPKPRVRRLHARGPITSYLESTAKRLITAAAAASAVINAPCPAGVEPTAARAARWLASPVC